MQRRKTHTQENQEVQDPSKKALELAFQEEENQKQRKKMENLLKESEIGKKITSKITKIVILLILLIMLS